jgi:threonine synthase
MSDEWLQCVDCPSRYPIDAIRYTCECGGLLSLERPAGWFSKLGPAHFDARLPSREIVDQSGVWRFREAVMSVETPEIITHPEGGTRLYRHPQLSQWAGVEQLHFKHEGENPTGSFKDRGMTVAMTKAVQLKVAAVACASTGNTSASLAAYASQTGKKAVVFLPAGKISLGKMAQTLAHGAHCLQVNGDFDAAMALVREVCAQLDIYLLNSVNPFRIEGQKTIVWELLQDLRWQAPDWIALPAGNLGNTSAFGKALREAFEGGWISKVPRLAAVQANRANPFYLSFQSNFAIRPKIKAETIATAIRIGDPVSFDRAKVAMHYTRGVVTQVSDEEILIAKQKIDRVGIGCEPASACSLAGVKKLVEEGTIGKGEQVVCVLTGHLLKDPDAVLHSLKENEGDQLLTVEPTLSSVQKALEHWL